jgi:predicted TIM-barrel fold metal-dependent hydrolase
MASLSTARALGLTLFVSSCATSVGAPSQSVARSAATSEVNELAEFHDSHFHLTGFDQEGISIQRFVDQLMGTQVGRAAVFGIPLHQHGAHRSAADPSLPAYYYYSFTDARIAMTVLSLPESKRARLDPMITGFNPTDPHAVAHIRRALETFPGVFTGIGEFSIHKELVTSNVTGEPASLKSEALDAILEFCAKAGLLVIFHNDIDSALSKKSEPEHWKAIQKLFRKHSKTSIVWAHAGVGGVRHSATTHLRYLEQLLKSPGYSHVHFDLSWDPTIRFLIGDPEALQETARTINAYPTRFLFGTDEVAPADRETYVRTFKQYEPLWSALKPRARQLVLKGNYERLFDEARKRVRAWEKANLSREDLNDRGVLTAQ